MPRPTSAKKGKCNALVQGASASADALFSIPPSKPTYEYNWFSRGRSSGATRRMRRIGLDTGSPVSDDYVSPNPFSGTLRKMEVHLEPTMTNRTHNDQIQKVGAATELAAQ